MPEEAKVETKENLRAVIEKAATDTAVKVGEEIKTEEKEVKKEELKKEESQVEDLTAEQLANAKNIYKALSSPDPEIQTKAIKILAQAAGLNIAEVKTGTKEEKQEAEATLLDLLKEGLGEFNFLADKLAPVLEKAFNKAIETKTKDIREEVRATREATLQKQVSDDIETAFGKFAIEPESTEAAALGQEVGNLMKQFLPAKDMNRVEYFTNLIRLAAGNKNIDLKDKTSKSNTERIESNRKDANSRLASERGSEVDKSESEPQKRMTLKESINDAIEKVAKQMTLGKK